MPPFSTQLRDRRLAAQLSLAELAARIHYSRGHIHHVETGERAPTRELAEAADDALDARGHLIAAYEWEERERQQQAATRRTLAASLAASRDLIGLAELDLDAIGAGVEETAIDYLATAPGPMLHRANALRDDVLQRLRNRHHKPHQRADLYVAAGRLSGILAYAALDLGAADAAMEHARAAAHCALFAGDAELAAWVAGTRSLIARFQGNYGQALAYIREGYTYVGDGHGTGEARLRCGEAQCLANLGDSRAANQALNDAEDARERIRRPDSLRGLFEFSVAKQHYYSASSLIWLDGGADARRAAREAATAIGMWQSLPMGERSLDDERLAHIYWATALVQLGEVDEAAEVLRPILGLAPEDQISWINKRLDRVASMLAAPEYRRSAAAGDLVEAIRAVNAA